MKRILTTFITILIGITSHAQLIQWDPEITVADGTQFGNVRPRAAIVGTDSPVVVFGKSSSLNNLFIARWNGSSFDPPLAILPAGSSSYLADWTGPDLDAFGSTVIATFKLEPLEGGHVYSVRSTDGGITFSDTIRVDSHQDGVAWMPSMGMDMNGNPVVTYMAHDGVWSNPRYVIVRSSDGGLNYGQEMEVSSLVPGETCDCCPAEMVINESKEILLFRNNESNIRDMYAVMSTDGGNTYTSYDNVDNLDWMVMSCPSTGANGAFFGNRLLTAYASAASGKYRVYVSSATTDGPIGFETRVQVPEPAQANGTQNFPRLSISGDTAVMAWRETVNGGQEIFCSVSLPGMDPLVGLTSFKQQSNTSTSGNQTNPEIIYKNGVVHLFYSDGGSGDLIYRRGTISATAGLNTSNSTELLHPNPSTGTFVVPADIENICLVDALGRKHEFTATETEMGIEIRIQNAPLGIYFVQGEKNMVPFSARLILNN